MSEPEMFEASFSRPRDYFRRPAQEQWRIDKRLGILDWKGDGLSDADRARFEAHYE